MFRKIGFGLITFGLLTACSTSYDVTSGDAVSNAGESVVSGPMDPLSSDGTWSVPADIPFGTYRTVSTDSSHPGYWYTCADAACEIDFDGNAATGRITAQIVNGPGFLVLDERAQFVHIERLVLTPVTVP